MSLLFKFTKVRKMMSLVLVTITIQKSKELKVLHAGHKQNKKDGNKVELIMLGLDHIK